MTDAQQPEGYKAKSFRGIRIDVEWHKDRSVTLSKEVVEYLQSTGDISFLIPPPPGIIYFMNDDYQVVTKGEQ